MDASPRDSGRIGSSIRERISSLIGKHEDENESPRQSGRLSSRLSQRDKTGSPRRLSQRDRESPRGTMSPRTSARGPGDCKISVELPGGSKTILYLPRTAKVDQVKAKLWTLAECRDLRRDDYVLGDAQGTRFQVEFQKLSRLNSEIAQQLENGLLVELVLYARDGRSSARGPNTPSFARRQPAAKAALDQSPFYTPQASRRGAPPAAAGFGSPQSKAPAPAPAPARRYSLKSPRAAEPAPSAVSTSPRETASARSSWGPKLFQKGAPPKDESPTSSPRNRPWSARTSQVRDEVSPRGIAKSRERSSSVSDAPSKGRWSRSGSVSEAEVARVDVARHRERFERDSARVAQEKIQREEERRRREEIASKKRYLEEMEAVKQEQLRKQHEEAERKRREEEEELVLKERRESLLELERQRREMEEKRAELDRKMRLVEERERQMQEKRRQKEAEEKRLEEEEAERRREEEEERRREEEQQKLVAVHVEEKEDEKESEEEEKRRSRQMVLEEVAQLVDENADTFEAMKQKQAEEEERRQHLREEREERVRSRSSSAAPQVTMTSTAADEEVRALLNAVPVAEPQRVSRSSTTLPQLAAPPAMQPRKVRISEEEVEPSKSATSSPSLSRHRQHKRTGSWFGRNRKQALERGPSGSLDEEQTSEQPPPPGMKPARMSQMNSSTPLLSRFSHSVKNAAGKIRGSHRRSPSQASVSSPSLLTDQMKALLDEACELALRRCAADRAASAEGKAHMQDRCLKLVEGKSSTVGELPGDSKMYWVDTTYADFAEWHDEDNLGLMFPEWNETIYADHLQATPHKTYVATDSKVGPIVLTYSMVANEEGDFVHVFWSDRGLHVFKVASEVFEELPDDDRLRFMVVERVVATDYKLDAATVWRQCERDVIRDELAQMERSLHSLNYKFGVLYARPNQDQNAMFANVAADCSPAYDKFLDLLGDRIELTGWAGFRGGLDVKHGHTGSHSVYTTFSMEGKAARKVDFEIMYHVSTLLPHSERDLQQLERKRHLGNDIVVMVFLDGGDEDTLLRYDPALIKSEFNHAFILIQPRDGDAYHVRCIYKSGVAPCNPYMPDERQAFAHGPQFRDWLLAKCVNSERVSYQCLTFSQKLRRTRKVQLKMLIAPDFEK